MISEPAAPARATDAEARPAAASRLDPELAERGFLHLKGVVPAAEVAALKRLVEAYDAKGNIHNSPIFEFLIERLGVHRKVKEILGEEAYYFGWCTVMPAARARPGGLHDDAKGLPLPVKGARHALFEAASAHSHDAVKHPIFPVYRLFIYLDDHKHHSGGTKVRARSHRRHALFSKQGSRAALRLRFGEILLPGTGYVSPEVEPGDAVLFNLKCKHAGHFVRLRGPLRGCGLPVWVDNLVKRVMLRTRLGALLLRPFVQDFHATRTSVSIDFCTDSDWSRGFQVNRLLHPNNRAWQSQFFDCNRADFAARLQRSGLPLLHNPSLRDIETFLREG